jgi:hypothetical protein
MYFLRATPVLGGAMAMGGVQGNPNPYNPDMDLAALNQRLNAFCLRVAGSREDYECQVPEREGRRGGRCGRIVCRRDRI